MQKIKIDTLKIIEYHYDYRIIPGRIKIKQRKKRRKGTVREKESAERGREREEGWGSSLAVGRAAVGVCA